MKEIIEFRINSDYAHLLFRDDEGENLGSIKRIIIESNDSRISRIGQLQEKIKAEHNTFFFAGWNIIRKYTNAEFYRSELLYMKIHRVLIPTGEDCGTKYDENCACNICGAGRQQIGLLHLRKSSIPKKDIAMTIGNEILVSMKFVNVAVQNKLNGISFKPVMCNNIETGFYQPFFLKHWSCHHVRRQG